ncbi:MAG: cytidine deaminase [Flavobacteriales bacterium]
MEKYRQRTLHYRVHQSSDELEATDHRLLESAKEALKGSYSPYSAFAVGAAIRMDDGRIVKGSNQENASFPSGICAERVAVWKAATEDPHRAFTALALVTERETGAAPVSPCGACRQVLSEYEERSGNPLRVLFPGGDGSIIAIDRIRDLLPFPFETASLKDPKG